MFYIFHVEVIIEQIDGARGGYPTYSHRYNVVACDKKLAIARAKKHAEFEHRGLLQNKSYVIITRAEATGTEVIL